MLTNSRRARGVMLRELGRGGVLSVVGLALLVLVGCATPERKRPEVSCEVAPWHFGQTEGFRLVTDHYVIYTTLQDRVLVDALPGFTEAAYENYTRLVKPTHVPDERMPVYLFASRGQWAAFTKKFTGSRAPVYLQVRNGGYSERGVSAIQYVTHSVTFPLFAHEGWHQYLYHHVNTRIPAWLNEGLAVSCEGQRWGSFGVKEFDAGYNPSRANVLAQALLSNRLHSLRTLLETHPGKIIEGSSRSVSVYYAQVWALMLFLQEGADGKYAEGFRRLLDKLGEVDIEQYARAVHIWSERESFNFGEALFRNFISEDVETVENEYFAFMRERFLENR